jgi:hypothetical protein
VCWRVAATPADAADYVEACRRGRPLQARRAAKDSAESRCQRLLDGSHSCTSSVGVNIDNPTM